ncbi:MAG: hypothetical protein JWP09_716 [Candidatus Taylorbacteria bacterium]|nr:hypothetical protein [Candidatus Taylorbacteria bacterium]
MKSLIPIFLILASVGIFVFYVSPVYQTIQGLQVDIASYEKAFSKSNEVLKKRQELQDKYKHFSETDLDSVKKLLPDHIDNVQLILDINGIARLPEHNMLISKIQINEDKSDGTTQIGPNNKLYSSILVSFKTKATYPKFVSFIKDLEQSLRLVDITSLSFKTDPKNLTEYSVTIRTYWLK